MAGASLRRTSENRLEQDFFSQFKEPIEVRTALRAEDKLQECLVAQRIANESRGKRLQPAAGRCL